MSFNFWQDLAAAKKIEKQALHILQRLTAEHSFIDVSDLKEYYHKGDIKATAADGTEYMLEIKGDSRIHETGNVLCEEENYWYDTGLTTEGNMYSDYQYYCILSQAARKMVIIDFKVLQANYRNKSHRCIQHRHADNISTYYLFPLKELKELGGIIAVIDFEGDIKCQKYC